jgi:predicted transcriptional regulator
MTMFSFRVDDHEAEEARRWAERLDVDRSELLRDALHTYLVRLRAEEDIDAWIRKPLTGAEQSLADVSDWGPSEDWAEWTDEAG